jgi:hypothetical protein
MSRPGFQAFAAFLLTGALACAAACSSVQNARIGVDTPPEDDTNWHPVADVLVHRCGTLDCHGQMGRNLRIWGCEGMRLGDAAVSSCIRRNGGSLTQPDEYEATFRSLVGLEPAVMSTVVAGQGQHPELLTFVRKARGTEAHKGGQIFTPGDVQDVCVTSWLAGATQTMSCQSALALPQFPVQDAGTE